MGDGKYWPSLDGVRAVAIASVVAYHLGHLNGGWLGVDLFFVLSGFLITDQLLGPRYLTGAGRLRAFWARRARRLLPAVVLLVVVLSVYAWAGGAGIVPAQLRAPALATLAYVANWQQIASHHGYFSQFAAPNPLLHTWSLAIEEQFYLLWPLALPVLVRLARGRRRHLAVLVGVLAAASAGWAICCAHLWGVDRAYLGTDTRAWELLLGAGAAVVLRDARPARRHRAWSLASIAGAAVVGWGLVAAASGRPWVWDGGTIAIASAALIVVVASVRCPGALLPRLLALAPLRWLGRVSYSLYLWHWPTIVVVSPTTTGLTGAALLAARLGVMGVTATASFYLVEQPLRRANWHAWWRRAAVPVSLAGAGATVVLATVGPAAASTATVKLPSATVTHALAAPFDPLPLGRVVSPADPVRVWLFGDSIINDASPGITAALQATGDAQVVANSTFPGWSFAHDPGWEAQWRQLIATTKPEVAIATWSWDDQLAAANPAGYRAFLRRAMSVVLTPGNGVDLLVLLQLPQSGPPESAAPGGAPAPASSAAWASATAGEHAWDAAARAVVASFPGHALYLSDDALFDPGGRYLTWFKTPSGSWLRARKLDNVHFCPYGAAQLGALVTSDLTPYLHLSSPAPGWEAAAWTRDPRYNDPPGACPDDQPPAGYRGVPVPGRG